MNKKGVSIWRKTVDTASAGRVSGLLQEGKTGFRPLVSSLVFMLVVLSVRIGAAESLTSYAPVIPLKGVSLIKGIAVDDQDPWQLEFLQVSPSNVSIPDNESRHLVKYFLTALTFPGSQVWVNLAPQDRLRVITPDFGRTLMGCDLLEQDLVLKKTVAELMHPEHPLGRSFWREILSRTESGGTNDRAVDAFNKVWVVADKAEVSERPAGENKAFAYVTQAYLKVLLEEDYQARDNISGQNASVVPAREDQGRIEDAFRRNILPELERRVNESADFIALRQAYHSLILAAWYKRRITDNIIARRYVNRNTVEGIHSAELAAPDKVWQRYFYFFQKGFYNFVHEIDGNDQGESVPRKFFSGGFDIDPAQILRITSDPTVHLLPLDIMTRKLVVQLVPVVSLEGDEASLMAADFAQEIVRKPVRKLTDLEARITAIADLKQRLEWAWSELKAVHFVEAEAERMSGNDAKDLVERKRTLLNRLLTLIYDAPPLLQEMPLDQKRARLQTAKKERRQLYEDIRKSGERGERKVMEQMNQQAIALQSEILHRQISLAYAFLTRESWAGSLTSSSTRRLAALLTLEGAVYSARGLERELRYRQRRLAVRQWVEQITAVDWEGKTVKTFPLEGFDIRVMPSEEGTPLKVSVRQQAWINVHRRLDRARLLVQQRKVREGVEVLEQLIPIYNIGESSSFPLYAGIRDKLVALVADLRVRKPYDVEMRTRVADIRGMIREPKQRIWVDVQQASLPDAVRAFGHLVEGYAAEVVTIARNLADLEYYVGLLNEKAISLDNVRMIRNRLTGIWDWLDRGYVREKQRSVAPGISAFIILDPKVQWGKDAVDARQAAAVELEKVIVLLQARIDSILRIVKIKRNAAVATFIMAQKDNLKVVIEQMLTDLKAGNLAQAAADGEKGYLGYFDYDLGKPGFQRAALSLQRALGMIDDEKIEQEKIPRAIRLLESALEDMEHADDFRVKVIKVFADGTRKTEFLFIARNTTLVDIIRQTGGVFDKVELNGKSYRSNQGRIRLPDRSIVQIRQDTDAAAVVSAAPGGVDLGDVDNNLRIEGRADPFGAVQSEERLEQDWRGMSVGITAVLPVKSLDEFSGIVAH